MALSVTAREVIFLLNLTEELRDQKVDSIKQQPRLTCNIFEDKSWSNRVSHTPEVQMDIKQKPKSKNT
jgi:hypothetical protein